MPKEFDDCQKAGGKIRTMKRPGGKFMHICIDKNGKTHAGEMHTKKAPSKLMHGNK